MGHDKPDHSGELAVHPREKLKITAYMLDWQNKIKRMVEEVNPARDAIREQRTRALGLAWLDPDHLDDYAIEAGITPESLRETLATQEGSEDAIATATRLRSSGEAERAQAARITGQLLTVIERGISDGEVGAMTAPKLLDAVSKLRRLTETRATPPEMPPAMSLRSVAGLLGND